MKTIKIQNCTDFTDRMFKVFVNGEKHIIDKRFCKFEVADNKPFEIKAKYIWGCSSKYTFEPKDNMLLQIYTNHRLLTICFALLIIAINLPIWIEWWSSWEGLPMYVWYILGLIALISYVIILRKKTYVIREVEQ
jgi:hypothetical protein